MSRGVFLDAQPAEDRDRIERALKAGAVSMAILMRLDFATGEVRLTNRTVEYTDPDGVVWQPLLRAVTYRDVGSAPNSLAPLRIYQLPIPRELLDQFGGGPGIIPPLEDKSVYQDREAELGFVMLQPGKGPNGSDKQIGVMSSLHTGRMDRLVQAMTQDTVRYEMHVEGGAARKRIAGAARVTLRDQQARFPTDLGLAYAPEVPTEAIRWPRYE